jgi:uncharacterized protein (TIGR02996 family)
MLQAILANPEDDGSRLAYADWLLERRDPRGELIALQVGLDSETNPSRRRDLRARLRPLWHAHRKEWLAQHGLKEPGSADKAEGVFRRGLLWKVQLPAERFLAMHESLFRHAPIEVVVVEDPTPEQLEAMCRLRLSNLRGLHLSGSHRLGADDFRRLWQSDLVATIDELEVFGTSVSPAVHDLFAAPLASRLRHLSLRSCHLDDEGAMLLAECTALSHLRALDLALNRLTAAGVLALACGELFMALERLDLGCNEGIGREGIKHLSQAQLPALKTLGLMACAEHFGTNAIYEAPWFGQLERLMLRSNLDSSIPFDLQMYEGPCRLVSLNLGQNKLGDEDLEELARTPLPALQHLSLEMNQLTGAAVLTLLSAPWARQLVTLDLNDNPVGDEGATRLASAEVLENLEELCLSSSEISDQGAAALAGSPALDWLWRLDLSCNDLGSPGLRALAASSRLEEVRLDTVGMEDDEVHRLFEKRWDELSKDSEFRRKA